MNKVVLVGRLTRDPEVKYSNNTAVTRFTLAINRNYKKDGQQQETDFINCVAFNKRAEAIANYVQKGHKLGVAGRIQTGSYTNQEGQRIYTTDVIVDEMEFLESKNSSTSNSQPNPNADADGFTPIGDDDDIPF